MLTKKLTTGLAALAMGAVTLFGAISPAAAATPNENFTTRVYQDFLLRQPTADELAWWSAFLSTNTRGQMLNNVFGGEEFAAVWTSGLRQLYLGDSEMDADFQATKSALETSGDFLAAELSVLSSATYFTAAGGTNTGFVTALYYDVLGWAPDSGGLAYWVGRLDTGTTRSSVAKSLIRSSDGATNRVKGTTPTVCEATTLADASSLADGSYCLVLDRPADASGATYWIGQLQATSQLPTLWSSLASSSEYFTLAQ